MDQKLEEQLCKDFPNLFADKNGDPRTTAMCFGFECGNGWSGIIRRLAEKLEPLCIKSKNEMTKEELKWYGGGPRASQVKEKYATLRFYMTIETDEMSKYIRRAEKESEVTCEQCGRPGECRGNNWVYTACLEHTKDIDKKEEK
jgi:hypothetical protein